MFTGLINILDALITKTLDQLTQGSEYARDWAAAAHRAMAIYLRTLIIGSMAITALAILLGWLTQSSYPALILGLFYVPAVVVMFVGRAGMHAGILIALADVILYFARNGFDISTVEREFKKTPFTAPKAKGAVSTEDTSPSGEVKTMVSSIRVRRHKVRGVFSDPILLKATARIIGWVVLVQMLILLSFAFPFVWAHPIVPITVAFGLALHVVLISGFQDTVKPWMTWSFIGAMFLYLMVSGNAWVNSVYTDMSYANRQRQSRTELTSTIREEATPAMAEAAAQIRKYTTLVNLNCEDPTNANSEGCKNKEQTAIKRDLWIREYDRLEALTFTPLKPTAVMESGTPTESEDDSDTAAASDPRTDPPAATRSKGWAPFSLSAIIGSVKGTVRDLSDWSNETFGTVPDGYRTPVTNAIAMLTMLVVAIWLAFALYWLLAMLFARNNNLTPEQITARRNDHRENLRANLKPALLGIIVLLLAVPMARWMEYSIREDAPVSARSTYTQPLHAASPSAPYVPEIKDPVRGNTIKGVVSASDLMGNGMFDTRIMITSNRRFTILISGYSLYNEGDQTCGANGCVGQMAGQDLVCPNDPYMMVIAQVGDDVYTIGMSATYDKDMLPAMPDTLKLGINQIKDPAVRARMRGGFNYTVMMLD